MKRSVNPEKQRLLTPMIISQSKL